ncbi:Gfo/Idh/MocA family protein [Mycolicibacterium diernhoferi]|uniref:Oxidoreductase n=1 Tax=Mycolicibacterium diernhoferi TaxID=1801 RepID=A0A1Q4HLL0_9MYCO|nr:Gfo/Idh/MocA family oxidoreductase [Mycolicibacterium diernhoferi]OJZ68281.1 oxidoreductase [Mycolicibacterium diernhoferi]OPE51470.1 oxidoreductase [Mycolicibacterium diernhoferi]PEG56159.1 gfo/Idh/MocA family oxidoreductase [Mycolicibacterium diernhoferi]QYL21217.1 Gfo/Idh/MocA family oxidoreductase [Mycolicibacterium diernhoferi]
MTRTDGLRIGVLGASRIAESAIVGPAAELGHRLVAVAARDRSRADGFAEKYGVERVLDSYQDVIDDACVDVIYNPLANSLHAPWNLAAIAAGKPVLSEKPFARDRSEALRVADAARSAGVTVLEGFHYFFHPVTQRAFALAADGALGAVHRVEVAMAMPEPAATDPRWSLDLAGGALMDLGCYSLHVMRTLGRLGVPGLGGAPSITRAHAVLRSPGVDASCDVELAFPDGATGATTNSMVAPDYSFTLKISGSLGDVLVHDFIRPGRDDRLTLVTDDGPRVERLGTRASYTYQLEAFAAHVQHGAALPFGTDDAVANMALVDAAYRSAGLRPR